MTVGQWDVAAPFRQVLVEAIQQCPLGTTGPRFPPPQDEMLLEMAQLGQKEILVENVLPREIVPPNLLGTLPLQQDDQIASLQVKDPAGRRNRRCPAGCFGGEVSL